MIPNALRLVIESLGWTLLHFVWQGAVIAAVLFALLAARRRATAQVRYASACGALVLAAVGFGATLAWQIERNRSASFEIFPLATISPVLVDAPMSPIAFPPAVAPIGEIDLAHSAIDLHPQPADLPLASAANWLERLRAWLPLVDAVWAIGVGLLSLRLFLSWRSVRRLCHSAWLIDDPAWLERIAELGRRLGVSRPVWLMASRAASVPFVVGCLRPMVLVPAGMISGLTPAEVEAIFAHELAHVRRHDYLVNLLLNVAETLLFYHPAVWWISAQIRREREHCCDDVAAAACGGALDYAKALLAVEQLRPAGNLLVAASGGSLAARIRRLAGVGPDRSSGSTWPLAAMVLFLSAALAVVAVGRSTLGEQKESETAPATDSTSGEGTSEEATGDQSKANSRGSTDDDQARAKKSPRARVTVTVLDDETGERIQNFLIVQGTKSSHVTSTFAERHPGAEPTTWEPHTLRSGNGQIFFKARQCYEETSFRVEAAGYQPQQSAWLERPTKATAIVMRMKKGEGISGRILQPDGQPAAGAKLAVGLLGKGISLEGAEFGHNDPLPEDAADRWRTPTVFKTDDQGRYRLPDETDPCAVLVVLHDSGAADMELADARGKTEIRLKAWGRIEGQVWWKDRAGVNESIEYWVRRDTQYPYLIRCERRTRSGSDGKFEFDKVLPGMVQVSRLFELPETDDDKTSTPLSFSFDGYVPNIASGKPTEVVFGGRGRKVVGRLVGRDSWEGITIDCQRQGHDLHIGMPGDDAMRRAYDFWESGPIGQLYVHDDISPRADGSFEIPNVLPADYSLVVRDPKATLYVATEELDVEPEGLSQPAVPLDMGEIKVKPADADEAEPEGEGSATGGGEPPAEATAKSDEPADKVDLPESGPPAGDQPPAVRLTLERGPTGEIVLRLNGGKIEEETLKAFMKKLADGNNTPPILLAADKGITYGEVVKVIDLLSSVGQKKVSLETRRQAVDGKPGPLIRISAIFTGAEIIAMVGSEVILASDVLPDVNHTLQRIKQRGGSEGAQPRTREEEENLRRLYMSKFLDHIIVTKLLLVEGKRTIPKEAWSKIEKQFDSQFDKEYLPKLLESENCKSRTELDLKLRKAGSSLMQLKRQSMESSFAGYFAEEKTRDDSPITADDFRAYAQAHGIENGDQKTARDGIRKERSQKRREAYLTELRKTTPVWTIFDGTDQAEAEIEQPDAASPAPAPAPSGPPLPAAGTEPASPEPAEPPLPKMTDEEVAAHPGTIKLVVVDVNRTPIPRFRVTTGIRRDNDGTVSIQFRKFPSVPVMVDQSGGKPADWRSLPVQLGQNGVCYWKPAGKVAAERVDYKLYIEAEGFQPDTFGWILGEAAREPLEFRLQPEVLAQFQVMQPDGPAAGATVAIPTPQRHAILENAHIRGDSFAAFQNESAHWGQPAFEAMRLDRPWLVKTDSDGRCMIPRSAHLGPLLVVHPSGALLVIDETHPFRQVQLLPWAVVNGRVQWQDKPGAGERIGMSTDYFGGIIRSGSDDVTTDESGNFEFQHVLRGVVHVSRLVLDDGKLPDGKRFSFPGLDTYVSTQPTVSTYALIGGQGRTIVGRLVGRKDWTGVTVSFAPPLPAEAASDASGTIKKLHELWADSSIGPIFFRTDFKPSADGSFELPRVLPGRYELTVSTPEMPDGAAARAEATIEPENTGEARPKIDLGDIEVGAGGNQAGRPDRRAAPSDRPAFGLNLKPGELFRGDIDDGPTAEFY